MLLFGDDDWCCVDDATCHFIWFWIYDVDGAQWHTSSMMLCAIKEWIGLLLCHTFIFLVSISLLNQSIVLKCFWRIISLLLLNEFLQFLLLHLSLFLLILSASRTLSLRCGHVWIIAVFAFLLFILVVICVLNRFNTSLRCLVWSQKSILSNSLQFFLDLSSNMYLLLNRGLDELLLTLMTDHLELQCLYLLVFLLNLKPLLSHRLI